MNLDEIKSRINPVYQDVIGTESHERKWLCDRIEELERQLAERDVAYQSACATVAKMHEAAVGEVRGPIVGVVEDVANLRQQVALLREALKHNLNAPRDPDAVDDGFAALAANEDKGHDT